MAREQGAGARHREGARAIERLSEAALGILEVDVAVDLGLVEPAADEGDPPYVRTHLPAAGRLHRALHDHHAVPLEVAAEVQVAFDHQDALPPPRTVPAAL